MAFKRKNSFVDNCEVKQTSGSSLELDSLNMLTITYMILNENNKRTYTYFYTFNVCYQYV